MAVIYQYHAHYQRTSGSIVHIDGIVQVKKRIVCMADYLELKKQIAPEHHDKLTIAHLSFLGLAERD